MAVDMNAWRNVYITDSEEEAQNVATQLETAGISTRIENVAGGSATGVMLGVQVQQEDFLDATSVLDVGGLEP